MHRAQCLRSETKGRLALCQAASISTESCLPFGCGLAGFPLIQKFQQVFGPQRTGFFELAILLTE